MFNYEPAAFKLAGIILLLFVLIGPVGAVLFLLVCYWYYYRERLR